GTFSHYSLDIASIADYYPFGSEMPGRSFNSPDYRYGFNGQEKDDEITGVTGSYYVTDFREYDARLGRWISIDPIAQAYSSPYAAFNNNPLYFVDTKGTQSTGPEGEEEEQSGSSSVTNVAVFASNYSTDPSGKLQKLYERAITDPNLHVIVAYNISDAVSQLKDFNKTNNIGNVLFVQHGGAFEADWSFGSDYINQDNVGDFKEQFKEIGSMISSINYGVGFINCYFGMPRKAEFMGELANYFNRFVIGNTGWTPGGAVFLDRPLFVFDMAETSYGQGRGAASEVIENWGYWAIAIPQSYVKNIYQYASPKLLNPDANNVFKLNTVAISSNGTIRVLGTSPDEVPARNSVVKTMRDNDDMTFKQLFSR
ncbi:MAG: RHS repeat-associated core domain-containing protein, partial [Bacteroidetes bacterium]|nr:RHS repeat-associated core domain-containing protein [Bacteroidota bacterium]